MVGSSVWIDRKGRTSKLKVKNVDDAEAFATFLGLVKSYSRAGLFSSGVFDEQGVVTDFDTGDYDTVDQKAVCVFWDEDIGRAVKLHLPAPKDAAMEEQIGLGIRVKSATGDTIAAGLSDALGHEISFQYGWFKSKK